MYDDQGDTKIGLATLDGGIRKIADNVASTTSAYGGVSFSVAKTGAIAFTLGTADNPGDIAVLSGGSVRAVTSLNKDLFSQKPPGPVEELWWESSKDRRKVPGSWTWIRGAPECRIQRDSSGVTWSPQPWMQASGCKIFLFISGCRKNPFPVRPIQPAR